MLSNLSNSTASRPGWRDPSSILLPIFIGAMRAAPYAAFFAMFLGEDFGLSGGLPAPTAWALAAISAIAFWAAPPSLAPAGGECCTPRESKQKSHQNPNHTYLLKPVASDRHGS